MFSISASAQTFKNGSENSNQLKIVSGGDASLVSNKTEYKAKFIQDELPTHLKPTVVSKIKPGSSNGKFEYCNDSFNTLKYDIVQYSDIAGINNDRPNGLLQYQGLIKVPISQKKWVRKGQSGYSIQIFRSVLFDATLNRIDKSKDEIDYNYTTFLLQNNTAKQSSQPWLATTDLWRYSNLHVGFRLVPINIETQHFRVQFQVGSRLLKSRPFSTDTITSGPDSGKVKSDFRSVYSNANFMEVYIKMLKPESNVDLSLTAGVRGIRLLDSYYEQFDILQQDPFQRTTALAKINSKRRGAPIYYASFQIGVLIGEERTVSTFLRVNYSLQKGNYLKPLSNVVDGRPVTYEERKFYNNFFQVHLGTTVELSKLFENINKKPEAKNGGKEGMISSPVI